MAYTEITIGATVARKSKGASTGRTGQVIELNDGHARVHWTKKANGQPMSQRNWINEGELMVVSGGDSKATASIRKKMEYIIDRVKDGQLGEAEMTELMNILAKVNGTSMWAIGIRGYMDGPRGHDQEFIRGLADQCMDDIFTMTCIVGQAAVIYLLRTVND
jgi:hypothetical protein